MWSSKVATAPHKVLEGDLVKRWRAFLGTSRLAFGVVRDMSHLRYAPKGHCRILILSSEHGLASEQLRARPKPQHILAVGAFLGSGSASRLHGLEWTHGSEHSALANTVNTPVPRNEVVFASSRLANAATHGMAETESLCAEARRLRGLA